MTLNAMWRPPTFDSRCCVRTDFSTGELNSGEGSHDDRASAISGHLRPVGRGTRTPGVEWEISAEHPKRIQVRATMNANELWKRYQTYLCRVDSAGLSLDISRMRFDDGFLGSMTAAMKTAYEAMDALEKGAIANPDEDRMVGHYWLRAPQLAPTPELTREIAETLAAVKTFASEVHSGSISPPKSKRFTRLLSIGIGGSALGPEFVADALGDPVRDKMQVHFLDNTDPDGIARELSRLRGCLGETLCVNPAL